MHSADDGLLFSAKDLIAFLGCTHAIALDLAVESGTLGKPVAEPDEYLGLLQKKGNEFEAAYLATLKSQGKSVREIARSPSLSIMAEHTRQAMRDGAHVIYQGALVDLPWHGYSDFLFRVETPSNLGPWSYEVADTKLARTARPKHVLQLCLYSQMIEGVQGVMPQEARVILGDGTSMSFRINDYVHYANAARERFERFIRDDARRTEAEPCAHCDLCRWSEQCDSEWKAADHLTQVARMTGAQTRKLRAAGVSTLQGLAELPEGQAIAKVQAETLARMRSQAALQFAKRTTGENRVEVLPPEPRRGFARLPKPNPGDLFFDMEGDPVYSAEGSLEYLFGFHHVDDGKEQFTAFWARDRASEKKAFEDALDFITSRLAKFPDAFVYHYAAYEQTALRRLAQQYGTSKRVQDDQIKRLAQTYGTRENEVDDLLRNRKLVDLYKVVREGVRISEPSYSLKNLEVFFAEKRTETIKSGGDSIVAFERWLVVGDDALLKQIEEYNAVDCRSTMLCRDWLLSLRPAETEWFDAAKEKSEKEAAAEAKRREADAHILDLRAQLLAGVSDEERPARELLGYLLEYHRREARREWWEFFKRLESSPEVLIEDSENIGGVSPDPTVQPTRVDRSMAYTLCYPDQDFKLKVGKNSLRTDTGKAAEILRIDDDAKRVVIKVGPSAPVPPPLFSLVADGPRNDTVQRAAIERYAGAVIEGRSASYRAVTSILFKERPTLTGTSLSETKADVSDVIDVVARMDRTHLVIQGPPGTGKTYNSAHAIVALLKNKKRVGVASMTHKAINNLLACVEEEALKQGVVFTGAKKCSEDEQRLNGRVIEDVDDNDDIFSGSHQLIGGTAWLFSAPEMDQQLDYLFIDEAGQVSLANVVAMGTSAKNIVLVGDQMQLSQPVKGAHPGGSGVSALDYLMGDWPTVPPDRGIFLAQTWRMHPDLCRFISDAFYESRLEPHPSTAQQRLMVDADSPDGIAPTGLRFAGVDHRDNSQKSPEEAARLEEIYGQLLGKEWVNAKGETRTIGPADILVVAPYNMQVNLLAETLPIGARVGTVDRFQGQEAAAVLISMGASSGDTAPRGVQFLLEPERLNVAISRGRCLATIIASPEISAFACRTVEQMRLLNTFCWAQVSGKARVERQKAGAG